MWSGAHFRPFHWSLEGIIVKTAQIRNGPGQNGPNPKRPNFFSQNGPTFFFIGNGFNLRSSGFFLQRPIPQTPPPPIVETISHPCAIPLLYSQNTRPYKFGIHYSHVHIIMIFVSYIRYSYTRSEYRCGSGNFRQRDNRKISTSQKNNKIKKKRGKNGISMVEI